MVASTITGLVMLGCDPSAEPGADSAPYNLSVVAQENWATIFNDDFLYAAITNAGNLENRWLMAVALTSELCKEQGQDWLAVAVSGNGSSLKLRSALSSTRARMARLIKAELWDGLRLKDPLFQVEMEGDMLNIYGSARITSFDVTTEQLRQRLEADRGWLARPQNEWSLRNTPNTCEMVIRFDKASGPPQLWYRITVASRFLPAPVCEPLPQPDNYQTWILRYFWIPAVRRFRLHGVQPRLLNI